MATRKGWGTPREGRPSRQQLNSTPGGQGGLVKRFKFFLTFKEARVVARTLGLGGHREWEAWCKAGKRPPNIPSHPDDTYRNDGWISWPDWLGYVGTYEFLPFAKARRIVRKLKLGSREEWRAWSKSGKRPLNISSNPHRTYRDDGFISYPDWLGYEGRAHTGQGVTQGQKKKKSKKKKGGEGWGGLIRPGATPVAGRGWVGRRSEREVASPEVDIMGCSPSPNS
jgi:hypothetical protein